MSTTSPTTFQISDLEKTSPIYSIIRQFTWLDLSLWHALFMSIVGPIVWIGEMPNFDFPSFSLPGGFWTTTTTAQSITFAISCAYFVYDTVCILIGVRKTGVMDTATKGFLFHHAICITSLSLPIIFGVDAAIVFSGFIAGELSNPFRGTAEIIGKDLVFYREGIQAMGEEKLAKAGYSKQRVRDIYREMTERQFLLDDIHYWLLAPLRGSCYVLYFFVFTPLVQLFTTHLTANLIILFTSASLVFLKWDDDAKKAVWDQLIDPFAPNPLVSGPAPTTTTCDVEGTTTTKVFVIPTSSNTKKASKKID